MIERFKGSRHSVARLMAFVLLVTALTGGFMLVDATVSPDKVEAAELVSHSRGYDIWLNKYETWAVGYTSWGPSWVANWLSNPYKYFLKGYLWLMARKARSYVGQGRCLVVSFGRYGWWVNPIPAFTSYTGGACR